VILAIKRDGHTIPGLPGPTETLRVGDLLTVYGEEHKVKAVLQPAPPAA
jgi:K+/H+ antiporter YhaU regulatory subunit KhtT